MPRISKERWKDKKHGIAVQFLTKAMKFYLEAACRLLRRRRKNSPSPFETAAYLVFHAGMEKVVTIGCLFGYICGTISREELKLSDSERDIGYLVSGLKYSEKCRLLFRKGIVSKKMLNPLLRDITELRNHFNHDLSFYAGFGVEVDWHRKRPIIVPHGPIISCPGPTSLSLKSSHFKALGENLINAIGNYFDSQTDFAQRIGAAMRYLEELGKMPCPRKLPEVNKLMDNLDKKYIGPGWSVLLEEVRKRL